jgi:hypothetical protein
MKKQHGIEPEIPASRAAEVCFGFYPASSIENPVSRIQDKQVINFALHA